VYHVMLLKAKELFISTNLIVTSILEQDHLLLNGHHIYLLMKKETCSLFQQQTGLLRNKLKNAKI
jgi:hypothetical protein